MTEIIDFKDADLRDISQRIKSGAVFAYPTDTVYGIGCNATNREAILRIFEIKGRNNQKPMSVAFASADDVIRYVDVDKRETEEIKERLPGPFTLIVKNKGIPKEAVCGLETLGIRIPDYPLLLKLIKKSECPVVTTSANISGMPPASQFSEIPKEIIDSLDFVLVDDDVPSGKASRVINLVSGKILRD